MALCLTAQLMTPTSATTDSPSTLYRPWRSMVLLSTARCLVHFPVAPTQTWRTPYGVGLVLPISLSGESQHDFFSLQYTVSKIQTNSFFSSWDGYKKNGYKNGYQVASDGSDSGTDIIFENGVLTPGFASLPVCELTEAMENLSKYDNNHRYPGFPCNQY